MDIGLQREWEYVQRNLDRPRKTNIYNRAIKFLDTDERMMLPEDYIDNMYMYDKVSGIAYIVANRTDPNDPETGVDWVWDHNIDKLLEKDSNVRVVEKVIIARLRTPWHKVATEWMATESDIGEYGEDWKILEVYVRVKPKGTQDDGGRWLLSHEDRQEYEENPGSWEVIEKSYLVAWLVSPESRHQLVQNLKR